MLHPKFLWLSLFTPFGFFFFFFSCPFFPHLVFFFFYFHALVSLSFFLLHNHFFCLFKLFDFFCVGELQKDVKIISTLSMKVTLIERNFDFYRLKMGNKWRLFFFIYKETWSYIISNHDYFTFKSFNPKEKNSITLEAAPCLSLLVCIICFLLSFFLNRLSAFSV